MSKHKYMRQHRAFIKSPYKNWHLKSALKKYKFHTKGLGDNKRFIDRW